MEKSLENISADNKIIEREKRIRSLLDNNSVMLLNLEYELLKSKLANSQISDEDFIKLFKEPKESIIGYNSDNKDQTLKNSDLSDIISLIQQANIIDDPSSDIETITLGSQVTVRYDFINENGIINDSDILTYILTGTDHSGNEDISIAKISSPIGRLLFGTKVGDKVKLPISNGQSADVTVLNIEQVI